jgi:Holliday junction resolvase RusA-like endonuclease
MFPLEFTVPGPPISHQSRNRAVLEAWRKTVRDAAARCWGNPPVSGLSLKITVSYYHEGESVRIDNDNMVKPVQDALNGLVYADDRQITDTIVRKTSIDGLFRVRGYSLVLLAALARGDAFLHIVIDHTPSHDQPLK